MNGPGKESCKNREGRAARLGWVPRLTMYNVRFYLGFGGRYKRDRKSTGGGC